MRSYYPLLRSRTRNNKDNNQQKRNLGCKILKGSPDILKATTETIRSLIDTNDEADAENRALSNLLHSCDYTKMADFF